MMSTRCEPDLIWMVVRDVLAPVVVGLAVGVPAVVALGPMAQWTAAQGYIYTLSCIEAYTHETRKMIRRFRDHRLSFPDCIAVLDAALADLTLKLTG
jgi:hypothetical protein